MTGALGSCGRCWALCCHRRLSGGSSSELVPGRLTSDGEASRHPLTEPGALRSIAHRCPIGSGRLGRPLCARARVDRAKVPAHRRSRGDPTRGRRARNVLGGPCLTPRRGPVWMHERERGQPVACTLAPWDRDVNPDVPSLAGQPRTHRHPPAGRPGVRGGRAVWRVVAHRGGRPG